MDALAAPADAEPAVALDLAPVFVRRLAASMFASVRASVLNHFNQERTLNNRQNFKPNRSAALAEWRDLCTA
jgi:putative transposase